MPNSYIPPSEVISPKRQWTMVSVLYDWGENMAAVAVGRWEGRAVLVLRWNGNDANPIGNPQSRGLPTWFVVPDEFRDSILYSLKNSVPEKVRSVMSEKVERAHEFIIESVVLTNTIADPRDRKTVQEAVFEEIGACGLTAKLFEAHDSSEYLIRLQFDDQPIWEKTFFGAEQTTANIREEIREAVAQHRNRSQKREPITPQNQ